MTTRRWLLTVAACFLVFGALALYKFLQIQSLIAYAESFPERSESVETYNVESLPVQATIKTLGSVVAPQTLDLRNELGGRIAEVLFTPGDRVQQGQRLLQLDIKEEAAQLKAAEARLKLAKLDKQRVAALRSNRSISEERLDQAEAELSIALADIAALKATIDKKTLIAPFEAVAGLHDFEVGELLQPNTHITTLVGINDYTWIDFNLPMSQSGLALGSPIDISLPNRPQEITSGEIIARDSVASSSSRNVMFRARVENNSSLTHNAAVDVLINGPQSMALTIPSTAIRSDRLSEYVFVLNKDTQHESPNAFRAKRQTVTLDKSLSIKSVSDNTPRVVVTQGLREGTLIAANGSFKLNDGLLVFSGERPDLSAANP